MEEILIDNLLAFIEGFALIVSPCILPILPIMLSGTIEGGNKRPLGIITGFVITFALFTFFARSLVQYLGVNLDLLRQLAFGFIILFGIILVSDYLSEKFNRFTQLFSNLGLKFSGRNNNDGFFSGFILGGLVSLIWVPCAGPILAAALVQIAIQKTTQQSFFIFLSFAIGSVIPMLIIALVGRKLINTFSFLKTHTHLLRKIFGWIIIIGSLIAAFSNVSSAYSSMGEAQGEKKPVSGKDELVDSLMVPYPAPALVSNSAWINSPPLTLKALKGKVVLIDFWTYSCINCIRTLPYLIDWYEKYHPYGFEIIGVHTPEFEFEKNLDNVKQAVAKDNIHYPVVLDNDYITWLNFKNQYWPAHYLIDKEGKVVYEHFGEGSYEDTEHNIRVLLGLTGQPAKENEAASLKEKKENKVVERLTPEIYFGYERAGYYRGTESLKHDALFHYTYPKDLPENSWALKGNWRVEAQKILPAEKDASIKLHFFASKVFIVMGTSSDHSIPVKLILNGKPIGKVEVKAHTLYPVVSLKQSQSGVLEVIPSESGVEFYTFTFGN